MGQTTPNISIYIPSAGETNYDQSFASGMINIDQHDHSGAPTKGVPIASSGLADGSVTYTKLNANVADTATGIGTEGSPFENRLTLLGLIKSMYQLGSDGILVKQGNGLSSVSLTRTIIGTANQIKITNGTGVSGNPQVGFETIIQNPTQPLFKALLNGDQTNVTGNGTEYIIPFSTVVVDQHADYSVADSWFEAPVTGNYFFASRCAIIPTTIGTSDDMTFSFWLNGAETERLYETAPNPDSSGAFVFNGSTMMALTAGDQVQVAIKFAGAGADTVGIDGSGVEAASFCGWLL